MKNNREYGRPSPIGLVDFDQTLADLEGALRRDLEAMRNPDLEPELPDNLWEDKSPHMKARMNFIKNFPGWWKNLKPLKMGFNILRMLRKKGLKIHALTKGPVTNPNAWTEKVLWFQEYMNKEDKMNITQDKGLFYGKILVDDYPGYIKRWLKYRPRGLVIMPATNVNGDFEHQQVVRYDGTNMSEVEDRVDDALKGMKGRKKE